MLPKYYTEGNLFSIPKFTLKKTDVEGFINELRGFHREFSDCFLRSEPRENFFYYMVGQFSELERKSIEPIALRVEGASVRSLQRFISDVIWDEEKMLRKYWNLLKEDMGEDSGVLIFDETDFPKKGRDSVGVARQYCGSLGKIENCQVGVFMAYASSYGYALLDKRLFIPEIWFSEGYKEERRRCELPQELSFKTKPQLATEMLEGIEREGRVPFKYIVADSIYGYNPEFIEHVERCKDKIYFVNIPSDTLCWLERPPLKEKGYRYKREARSKFVAETRPETVQRIAEDLNDYFWYRRKVSLGTKGVIEYEFTKRRVVLCKRGLPDKEVWLIIKRSLEDNPSYWYYISNAPINTRLSTFVWLSGMRWAIEQCFQETKGELGMDHYEVRKYRGWHHHILTCMLAHFFLWHLKIRLGEKSTLYYTIAA